MKSLLLLPVAGIVLLAALFWIESQPIGTATPARVEPPPPVDAEGERIPAPAAVPNPVAALGGTALPHPAAAIVPEPQAPPAAPADEGSEVDPRIFISPRVPEPRLHPDEVRQMRWGERKRAAGEPPVGAKKADTPASNPHVSVDRQSTPLPTVGGGTKHDSTDVELRVPLSESWAVRNRVRVNSVDGDEPEREQTGVDATTGVELRF